MSFLRCIDVDQRKFHFVIIIRIFFNLLVSSVVNKTVIFLRTNILSIHEWLIGSIDKWSCSIFIQHDKINQNSNKFSRDFCKSSLPGYFLLWRCFGCLNTKYLCSTTSKLDSLKVCHYFSISCYCVSSSSQSLQLPSASVLNKSSSLGKKVEN